VPTSVLLAVLAAAGLLALAPALVRRYDATERLVAERAASTARVLERSRRRRSVPGRHPVNTSRVLVVTLRAPVPEPDASPVASAPPGRPPAGNRGRRPAGSRAASRSSEARALEARALARARGSEARGAARSPEARSPVGSTRRRPARRYPAAVYRRRRVLAGLVLLNLAELFGVVVAGPGFWSGFSVTAVLLAGYVVHLRNLAVADRRRQRAEAREAAWLAARQAEVRREQARRAAARREIRRRLAEQREAVRRAAQGYRPPPGTAAGGAVTSASYSYRRGGPVRGRPYQAGPSSDAHSA
jgi:hypothetical protein